MTAEYNRYEQALIDLGYAQACAEILETWGQSQNRLDHMTEMTLHDAKTELEQRGINIRNAPYFEQGIRMGITCTLRRMIGDVSGMMRERKETDGSDPT